MSRIKTHSELRNEIRRLQGQSLKHEENIRQEVNFLKDGLTPLNLLLGFISKRKENAFYSDPRGNSPVSRIFHRLLLKIESKLEHHTYALVDNVMDKVKDFVNGIVTHEARNDERKSNR